MNNQIEYKTFTFEYKDDNSNEEYFYFTGYASVFGNVDYGDDVIERGAFKDSIAKNQADKKYAPILWQHEMEEPIGVAEELAEDTKGLKVMAKLPLEDEQVKGKVKPQVKIGSVREMSIGFIVKDFYIKEGIRYIKKVDLIEISLVTKAMNKLAQIESFKSFSANTNLPFAPRDLQWDGNKAEQNIREYTGSTDKPSADYKKYFMYFDSENQEQFGAYKLLFADIIDGKPYIVPRAVFAIAGALQGARGGLDVPEQDRMRIQREVIKLYKKMATEFNDTSLVAPFTKSFDSLESLSDIESVLKSYGLSNNEAKTLISKVKEFSKQRDVAEDIKQRDVVMATKKINELALIQQINNLSQKILNNKF